MEPFALPIDVADIWRPLTTEEESVAEALLEQASMKLRTAVRDIDTAILTSPLKTSLAKAAVVNAVKRVLQNPDGYSSMSFKIDDYSQDNRFDSTVSSSALYIDARDLAGLVSSRSAWGTIRMGHAL